MFFLLQTLVLLGVTVRAQYEGLWTGIFSGSEQTCATYLNLNAGIYQCYRLECQGVPYYRTGKYHIDNSTITFSSFPLSKPDPFDLDGGVNVSPLPDGGIGLAEEHDLWTTTLNRMIDPCIDAGCPDAIRDWPTIDQVCPSGGCPRDICCSSGRFKVTNVCNYTADPTCDPLSDSLDAAILAMIIILSVFALAVAICICLCVMGMCRTTDVIVQAPQQGGHNVVVVGGAGGSQPMAMAPMMAQPQYFAHPHAMNPAGSMGGWICHGAHRPGGCRRGIVSADQTMGIPRYNCAICNFDLCDMCAQVTVLQ